ncbi:hypothetical protein ACKKBF_B36195 [Auxenochlorella protothecoides x Auxenochlorella symbiontica]
MVAEQGCPPLSHETHPPRSSIERRARSPYSDATLRDEECICSSNESPGTSWSSQGSPVQSQENNEVRPPNAHLGPNPAVEPDGTGDARSSAACQVCGAPLEHMHFLEQVSHVKRCMGGRRAARRSAAAGPRRQASAPAPPRSLPDVLKAAGLSEHAPAFQRAEVTVDILHTLSDAELAELGITQAGARQRLLGSLTCRPAPAPVPGSKAPRPLRQVLLPIQLPWNSPAPSAAWLPFADPVRDHSPAPPEASGRAWEAAALSPLRRRAPRARPIAGPASPPRRRARLACLGPGTQLPPGSRLVSPPRTLWHAAGTCTARGAGPSASERLARQEAAAGAAAGPAPADQLNRGGRVFAAPGPGAEPRGAKLVKLQALRSELEHHRATVRDLEALVAGLEAELEGGGY